MKTTPIITETSTPKVLLFLSFFASRSLSPIREDSASVPARVHPVAYSHGCALSQLIFL